MFADRDLLFGILALQNGLIDQVQLISAFQAWARDRCIPLSDHIAICGDVGGDGRVTLDAVVSLFLRKYGEVSEHDSTPLIAGLPLGQRLTLLDDPEITVTLARFRSGSPHSKGDCTLASPGLDNSRQRFQILRPHARGGLGVVSVALDGELKREVAFKQILDEYADDPDSRVRFLREAEITGGLEHPGIVPVYGLGTCGDGRPYYAMRLIRGETLKDAISRHHDGTSKARSTGNSLELRKLLRCFTDACNAIEYAHSRGVLHRDIKPSNMIVGKYGETLIIDWGLAKVLGREKTTDFANEGTLTSMIDADSSPTLAGSAMGTPSYMSPEQAAGQLELLGPASDVYSLGATLYCLITGRAPFEGDNLSDILKRVALGQFAPPKAIRAEIPPALDAICRKAMALHASERYGSPRALAGDIDLWLADEPVGAWAEPVWARSTRWARRHKPVVAMTAAILVTTSLALAIGTRLIANERDQARSERNEARRQKQEAQLERDRAVKFSIQAESKELQLRIVFARRLLLQNEPKQAFVVGLLGLESSEELIRLHPSSSQLKQDRIDLMILCARIMSVLDAESMKWVVAYIERGGNPHPKTAQLALLRARDASVKLAEDELADPWQSQWCVDRLMTTARLQRDSGFASDSFESFLLCHESLIALQSMIFGLKAPMLLKVPVLYNDACAQAQCANLLAVLPSSIERAAERNRFAEGAIVVLKEAIRAGLKDTDQIRSDPDLDPLRFHPEFRDLIDDLAFPSAPFAR